MSEASGYSDHAFVAEFYDFIGRYRDRSDVEFYIEAARQAKGPVLEIGCGTGRILLPIARAGFEILGLDLSPHMLRRCRERLQGEPGEVQERVSLVHGDMRSFKLNQQFHLVTTPFRSFQHLMFVEDQLACLACVHQHLVVGGRFVLDVFDPSLEALTRDNLGQIIGEEPAFSLPDGRQVVRRHRIMGRDLHQQIIDAEFLYEITAKDGVQETLVHAFQMRYLFRFEAEHLLERSGFKVESVYADFDKRPYGSGPQGELLIMARKR